MNLDLGTEPRQSGSTGIPASGIEHHQRGALPGLRAAFIPHVATLRPVGGFYLLILGTSFLLLPQGQLGVWLQPVWIPGALLVTTGLMTLWLTVLDLSRRLTVVLTVISSLAPLGVAIAYALIGAFAGAAVLGFLALGLLLAPFVPRASITSTPRPDALGLVFGGAAAVQGLDYLVRTTSAEGLLADLGVYAPPIAVLLLVGGCAVILTQLIVRLPRWVRWASHVLCGLTVIVMQVTIAVALDPLYWSLGAAALIRGATILSLPWLSDRLMRIDDNAFQLRVSLALLTTAIVGVVIALPIVIATITERSTELTIARHVAFASTLIVMLLASMGGWVLAGKLTNSLTQLMRGVDQVAAGQRAALLPRAGVTEVMALSNAVQQMAQTLEARAEERAILLERERQARAEAQEAVGVRDAFLSIAAHELRTPLTALLGNAQLVERRVTRTGSVSERDQRAIASIAEQAARLNRMITLLFDISRLETGQLQLDQVPLDLGQLLGRVVEAHASLVSTHTIVYEPPPTPLMVFGDELRLWQVFENLIGNAIKYSPAGGTVTIHGVADADHVQIEVTDQGIGIPATALPQLFQRFYRAHNVEERRISGMGVGLYVVNEIVQLHGGTITVRSHEGQGSTFTIVLPRYQQVPALADHSVAAGE
jgi:signal transduction histidine kinase